MKGKNIKSVLEITVAILLDSHGIQYQREYKFSFSRKFRFDFAILEHKIGIEIQGGQWLTKSGHNTGKGLQKDYEKLNLAQIEGWKVLQYSTDDIKKNPFKITEDIQKIIEREEL